MGKIEAKNIIKYFEHDGKPLKAIGGVNLTVNDGEFVCIVGPSGCGKSTFLRILAGLEKPDDGEILLDGKKLVNTGPDRIMVFQEGALFPWLTVEDNVEYGLKVAGIPEKERHDISKRYLDMMQLSQFANSYTYQLSTGMKQRVAIARALVMDPDVLLMDEPSLGLAPVVIEQIFESIRTLNNEGQTILLVEENVSRAINLSDHIYLLDEGQITWDGSGDELSKNDRLMEVYLGM